MNVDPAESTASGQSTIPVLAPLSQEQMELIHRAQKKREKRRQRLREKAARKSAPGINTFAMVAPDSDVVELFPG